MSNTQLLPDDIDEHDSRVIGRFHRHVKNTQNPGTAKEYRNYIKRFRAWLAEHDESLWEVDGDRVEDWLLDMLDEGAAPDPVVAAHSSVNKFYGLADKWADDDDLVPPNPTDETDLSNWSILESGTRKSQETRDDIFYLIPEEIEKLTENVAKPKLRNELIIRMLYQTGVRCGELRNIRLDDINRDLHRIKIRADKTEDNRDVGYHANLEDLLWQWVDGGYRDAEPHADSRYLFPTQKSDKISRHTVENVVKTAAEYAGLQETLYVDRGGSNRAKITPHTLRHSFAAASILPDVGQGPMPIRHLQELMGHDSIKTTERYLNLRKEDRFDAYRRYGPEHSPSSAD